MARSWLGIDKDIWDIGGHKILHIGYITIIYLFFGYMYAYIFERIFGVYNQVDENNKTVTEQILELIIMLWFAGVFLFIINHTAHILPVPKILRSSKYDHNSHTDEIRSTGIFIFIFLFFQNHLFAKIRSNFIRLTRITILPNI